ncbi:polyprotein [Operophtera brumata]|uniref:Polyprotein n=2 Tax=Operophtera brumata TaxID=104452 RepID=A0A0L7KTK1_OPEBR|nr:polyprotein [Operophtera brumata]
MDDITTRNVEAKPQTLMEADDGKLKVTDQGRPRTSAGSAKGEIIEPLSGPPPKSKSVTRKSSASSVLALKKNLELEAAKEKARIQMELIDKKLAADLAAVEEQYSPQASMASQCDGKDVENWLEHSQHELEKQEANNHGTLRGSLCPVQQLAQVKKLNPLPQEYYKDIVPFSVKIKNYVAAVRELKREEYLQGVSVVNIVLSKLPTVLLSKWADYSYPLITVGTKARLDILSDFLSDEAIKISTCSANLMNIRWDNKRTKYSEMNSGQSQTVLLQTDECKQSDNKCRFCRDSVHKLTDCKKFKKSLRKNRWSYVKRIGICYKCLLCQHDRKTCPAAACDVAGCGEPHHRLLHYVPSSRQNNNTTCDTTVQSSPTETVTETENNPTESVSVNYINMNSSVLLKVVPIVIYGPNGKFSASALLDDGSTVSLMSAKLAARAGLRGRKLSMRVRGAWDNTELQCESELVDLTLSNKQGNKYDISLRTVNELNLPKQDLTLVNYENYNYLRKIRDELCTGLQKPEVLIGQDNYQLLIPLEVMVGGPSEPCATRTPMGWCLHGLVPHAYSVTTREDHSTLFITDGVSTKNVNDDDDDDDCSLRNLHDDVRRYFSVESMGVSACKPRQNTEEQRAWQHLEQTATLTEGRWQDSNVTANERLGLYGILMTTR